jgi:hypothetical protein
LSIATRIWYGTSHSLASIICSIASNTGREPALSSISSSNWKLDLLSVLLLKEDTGRLRYMRPWHPFSSDSRLQWEESRVGPLKDPGHSEIAIAEMSFDTPKDD